MASHHAPFQALGPVDWDAVPQDGLGEFMGDVFDQAQVIVESIPSPATRAAPTGRARAQTDSAVIYADIQRSVSPGDSASSKAAAQQLRKEWKEIKLNPRDNPLDISVYKLSAKDGKGAWFARRSVHEGLAFEKWKMGLEKEFPETMKVQGSPGSGNIRGIGAEKNVEHKEIDGTGHLNVFQLSAQFPGPTSPRDFITLLLTSDVNQKTPEFTRPLRQYVVVSKPCVHPECPPRPGIIRGTYESVEIVREIPSENMANKRSLSSADLTPKDNSRRLSVSQARGGQDRLSASENADERPMAIEWLMVTRSDPGGSVPRFMIEKGTPPGIVGDAGKFLTWATKKSADNFAASTEGNADGNTDLQANGANRHLEPGAASNATNNQDQEDANEENIPSSNGLYGIISGAFGAATYVAAGLRQQFSNPMGYGSSQGSLSDTPEQPEEEDVTSDDSSSINSFSSALEKRLTVEREAGGLAEITTEETKAAANSNYQKELEKLDERRRKAEESFAKSQERMQSKRHGDKEKDEASLTKLREKHEKELAKQEAKYQREMKKIEQKRQQEERKAEARRRKTVEREEKSNMSLELEKARAERDLALKQIEILRTQVGDLQSQNTMLVARFGKMGVLDRADSLSSKGSKGSGSRSLSRTGA